MVEGFTFEIEAMTTVRDALTPRPLVVTFVARWGAMASRASNIEEKLSFLK